MQKIITHRLTSGGSCIADLPSGKKVFVYGALPEEEVEIEITNENAKFATAKTTQVITESKHRVLPKDSQNYLSTSPLQIFEFPFENKCKADLIKDAFSLHKLDVSEIFPAEIQVKTDNVDYGYRNKYTYFFDGYDYATVERNTHNLQKLASNSLPNADIIEASKLVKSEIEKAKIKPEKLKSLIIRANENGSWAAKLQYSGRNKLFGKNKTLTDYIFGLQFQYGVDSFFQINLPVYKMALQDIKDTLSDLSDDCEILDIYCGVGSIGLAIAKNKLSKITLVDVDKKSIEFAQSNIGLNDFTKAEAILAKAKDITELIKSKQILVLDPPRVGLDRELVKAILEKTPETIVYLSCNPSTQARDISYLLKKYQIIFNSGYNFFARTEHIENLLILRRK